MQPKTSLYLKDYMVHESSPFHLPWKSDFNATQRYEAHRAGLHAMYVRCQRFGWDDEVAVRCVEQDYQDALYCTLGY
jgi:hypothetical protein